MDSRTTAAVGGIGALAFMLVGIGLWHVAGVLDSMTSANTSLALQAAATATDTSSQAVAVAPLPKMPRSPGTGSASATTGSEKTVNALLTVAGVGNLNNLIALKSDLTCTVSTVGSSPERSGTVYVSEGNLRGNFVTNVGGQRVASSMINSGGYLYAWMDGGTHGVRLLAVSGASGSAIAAYGGVNPVQEISYSCNLWKVDLREFDAPNGVTFTDTAGN